MNPTNRTRRRALRLMPALAAITASLALAACGSSSSSSSSTTSTSASASSTGGSSANRTALVACLKKHGITPSAHVPSGGASSTPVAAAGGRELRHRRGGVYALGIGSLP
jgi:hypothetical protein